MQVATNPFLFALAYCFDRKWPDGATTGRRWTLVIVSATVAITAATNGCNRQGPRQKVLAKPSRWRHRRHRRRPSRVSNESMKELQGHNINKHAGATKALTWACWSYKVLRRYVADKFRQETMADQCASISRGERFFPRRSYQLSSIQKYCW